MTTAPQDGSRFSGQLAEVLRIHFDPTHGAPHWIELAKRLNIDPRAEIRTINDLHLLGLMDQDALRTRPLSDFIPRSIAQHPDQLVVVQTGGTLGDPMWTSYTREDYEAAFVRPFVEAARHVRFPEGGTWLYVGPSGPHVIGRAARSIARETGAAEPFTVDFDSRWVKKLPAGSFAKDRYLQHVLDQAMAVIEIQPITHLFTTPPVLTALAEEMSPTQRRQIRGVHYGGMAIAREQLAHLQHDDFPQAVHLSGYGNTLFGCCLELDASPGRELRYFPHGDRLVFGALPEPTDDPRLIQFNEHARGRCVFSRLDASMLLVNFVERDEIELVRPTDNSPASFHSLGVLDPGPCLRGESNPPIGIY
jgi:thienamycin biosynthesis protein ThnN